MVVGGAWAMLILHTHAYLLNKTAAQAPSKGRWKWKRGDAWTMLVLHTHDYLLNIAAVWASLRREEELKL